MLQLDVPLASVFNFILWQRCVYSLASYGHKNLSVGVMKGSRFDLKYL